MVAALRRAWSGFVAFNRQTTAPQERWLRAQRPWEDDWMHWMDAAEGWRLEGELVPPERNPFGAARGLFSGRDRSAHGSGDLETLRDRQH